MGISRHRGLRRRQAQAPLGAARRASSPFVSSRFAPLRARRIRDLLQALRHGEDADDAEVEMFPTVLPLG